MPDDARLSVGNSLRIPRSELSFRATRAGGPGGQHVNTSSTRIELWWHLPSSGALTEGQRALLAERMAHRLDSEGWLRLVEAGSRSQLRNRQSVTARFVEIGKHTSELQSPDHLVCRLLLEKKKNKDNTGHSYSV